jgi:hypothetical protein
MLKNIKLICTVTILLCFFLPLSQCQFKNPVPVEVEPHNPTHYDDAVYENLVFSKSFINSQAEFGIEHILVILTFFGPIMFALTSYIRQVAGVVSLVCQLFLSIWLIYFSKEVIFFLSSPLIAGWILLISSALYFVIITAECFLAMRYRTFESQYLS